MQYIFCGKLKSWSRDRLTSMDLADFLPCLQQFRTGGLVDGIIRAASYNLFTIASAATSVISFRMIANGIPRPTSPFALHIRI